MSATRAARLATFDATLPRHMGRLLSAEDERDLARRIEQGDTAARQTFIEANQRLVTNIARRYLGYGVALTDLIQEGNIGLIQAVDRFDWRKGTRFSTCATLWVQQAICRAVPHLRYPIHIPARVLRDASRRDALVERLAQQLRRAPTQTEIEEQASDIACAESLSGLPLAAVSLDATGSEDDEAHRPLIDALSGDLPRSTERMAMRSLASHALNQYISRLPEREQLVLRCRYGLDNSREHTLSAIAHQLGLSRQRIKQIEALAIRHLRAELAKHPEADDLFE